MTSRVKGGAAASLAALFCFSAGVAIAPLAAQEPAASQTLLPGKGAALTMARCAVCHDITHVTRTRLSRGEWEDNIKVMIARGMPVEPQEIPIIVEYLSTYYNRDQPPPPPDQAAGAPDSEPAPVARLLSDYGCIACHTMEQKLVGPAFRNIAKRYKNDSSAAALLMRKVKEGGTGVYGDVPMPPHPQIADADVKRIVDWVLQQ